MIGSRDSESSTGSLFFYMQELKDIHVKKIDLVGIPAIQRGITLFKSKDDEVNTEQLLKAIRDLDDEGLATLRKELATDPIETFKNLDEEKRAEVAKLLGFEKESDEDMRERILKALQGETEDEDVLKGLDDEAKGYIRDEIEKSRKDADELKKSVEALQKEIQARDDKEETNKAMKLASELENLGLVPDEHAQVLKELSKVDGWGKIEERLKAASTQLEKNELFKERGTDFAASTADSLEAQIENRAQEVLRSEKHPKIDTIEKARVFVMESDPEGREIYKSIVQRDERLKKEI